jgi:hypothetical protein
MAKKQNFIKVAILALLKAFDAKLEEIKTDAGAVLYAEVFEVGEPVFILEADAQIPLPVGDYMLEDGRKLTVTEEGIIAAIAEVPAEGTPAAEGDLASDPGEKSYTVNEIKALIDAGLSKEKTANEAKVKALETKLAELEAKLTEEPEPEGIKPNPEGRRVESVKLGTKKLTPVEVIFEKMSES